MKTTKTWLWAIGLGVLGFFGNYLKLPLFLNIDFLFGSALVMGVLYKLGIGPAILASLIASSCTVILWNHPWAIVIFTAEVGFVALFHRRWKKVDLILFDILYWLVLGWILVVFFYHEILKDSVTSTAVIILKQSLNGIFNAVLASAGLTIWSVLSNKPNRELPSYRRILFVSMVSLVVFPALVIQVIEMRTSLNRQVSEATDHARKLVTVAQEAVSLWTFNRIHMVEALCDQVSKKGGGSQTNLNLVKSSFEGTGAFTHMLVFNEKGIVQAAYPEKDSVGKSNVGKDYSERPYFNDMKKSLTYSVGEVFYSKVRLGQPTLSLNAPLLKDKQLKGFCSGVVDPLHMLGLMKTINPYSYAKLTLLDKKEQVISSTDLSREMKTQFSLRKDGILQVHPRGVIQWVPPAEKGKNIMSRWVKSLFVVEELIHPLIPWKIIVELEFKPILDRLILDTLRYLLFLWGLVLVVAPLSHILTGILTKPIQILVNQSRLLPDQMSSESAPATLRSNILEVDGLLENFATTGELLRQQYLELSQKSKMDRDRAQMAERQFRNLFEQHQSIMLIVDPESGLIEEANPFAIYYYGYAPSELKGKRFEDLGPVQELGTRKWGTYQIVTHQLVDKSFRVVEAYCSKVLWEGKEKLFYIIHDITQRKESEDLLTQTAQENVQLLSEVNHRVKNNLIAIQGLILSEKARPESNAPEALEHLNGQIQSLLETHQLLSTSKWRAVNLMDLAKTLVAGIPSFMPNQSPKFLISGEDIMVSPRQASHLALVINELATNSLKYGCAAAGTKDQTLVIEMNCGIRQQTESGIYWNYFTFKDHGPGFPEEVLAGKRKNVGLALVQTLVQGSLRGRISLRNEGGALVEVLFKQEEINRT